LGFQPDTWRAADWEFDLTPKDAQYQWHPHGKLPQRDQVLYGQRHAIGRWIQLRGLQRRWLEVAVNADAIGRCGK